MPKTTTSKRNHDLGCFATQNDGLPETFYGNDSVTFHYIFFQKYLSSECFVFKPRV